MIQATETIVITTSPERVWEVLTDFQKWPDWNSGVTEMKYDGPLSTGSVFRWKGGGLQIHSTITEVRPCERITWSGKAFGIRAIHTFTITKQENKVQIESFETFTGLLPTLLPIYMQKLLQKSLISGLEKLKLRLEVDDRI